MYLSLTRISILLAFGFGVIYCSMQIVPEKIEFYFKHPDHVQNATLKVRRYSRQSPYFIVGESYIKRTWNNNVTVLLTTYEYLHNEYRLSFMTLQAKLCDFINKDMFLGPTFRRLGFICPIFPSLVVFHNMSLYWEHFPYLFPFTKGLANVTFRSTATNELLAGVRVFINVKQTKEKRT